MKTLYLDTEFNGFGGALISMALVPEDTTIPEFYKELDMREQLHPWVKENVVPHLVLAPCTRHEFQQALGEYLWRIGNCVIIADWPDDIKYFCDSLILGPGQMMAFIPNLKFELDQDIKYESVVPHNALHDARAIRDFCVKRNAERKL